MKAVLVGGRGWRPIATGYVGHTGNTYTWSVPGAIDGKPLRVESIGVDRDASLANGYVKLTPPGGPLIFAPDFSRCGLSGGYAPGVPTPVSVAPSP